MFRLSLQIPHHSRVHMLSVGGLPQRGSNLRGHLSRLPQERVKSLQQTLACGVGKGAARHTAAIATLEAENQLSPPNFGTPDVLTGGGLSVGSFADSDRNPPCGGLRLLVESASAVRKLSAGRPEVVGLSRAHLHSSEERVWKMAG